MIVSQNQLQSGFVYLSLWEIDRETAGRFDSSLISAQPAAAAHTIKYTYISKLCISLKENNK